jgi:hypothetical protein
MHGAGHDLRQQHCFTRYGTTNNQPLAQIGEF